MARLNGIIWRNATYDALIAGALAYRRVCVAARSTNQRLISSVAVAAALMA